MKTKTGHLPRSCHLDCPNRTFSTCVCHLIAFKKQKTAITLGVHVGLRHHYGPLGLPACIHGQLGFGYWSTKKT
jgi:hypothetical protein